MNHDVIDNIQNIIIFVRELQTDKLRQYSMSETRNDMSMLRDADDKINDFIINFR